MLICQVSKYKNKYEIIMRLMCEYVFNLKRLSYYYFQGPHKRKTSPNCLKPQDFVCMSYFHVQGWLPSLNNKLTKELVNTELNNSGLSVTDPHIVGIQTMAASAHSFHFNPGSVMSAPHSKISVKFHQKRRRRKKNDSCGKSCLVT